MPEPAGRSRTGARRRAAEGFPEERRHRHDSGSGEGLGSVADVEGEKYDPDYGIPRKLGEITCSSPPIVVNGVIVVWPATSRVTTRRASRTCPADIQGYDAKTGKHLWKFHVIPRPGEFGHETWENDAWVFSGNIASWAPSRGRPGARARLHRDERVDLPVLHGYRPGYNLFGGSVLALGRQDRQAQMALPGASQRALELRYPDRADPDGSHGRRAHGSRR